MEASTGAASTPGGQGMAVAVAAAEAERQRERAEAVSLLYVETQLATGRARMLGEVRDGEASLASVRDILQEVALHDLPGLAFDQAAWEEHRAELLIAVEELKDLQGQFEDRCGGLRRRLQEGDEVPLHELTALSQAPPAPPCPQRPRFPYFDDPPLPVPRVAAPSPAASDASDPAKPRMSGKEKMDALKTAIRQGFPMEHLSGFHFTDAQFKSTLRETLAIHGTLIDLPIKDVARHALRLFHQRYPGQGVAQRASSGADGATSAAASSGLDGHGQGGRGPTDECPICLVELGEATPGGSAELRKCIQCVNVFHKDCLFAWLEKNDRCGTCPNCQAQILHPDHFPQRPAGPQGDIPCPPPSYAHISRHT